MIHELKTEKPYFIAVAEGRKTFEVRQEDRDFREGDYLALNETEKGEYTGRCLIVQITYILRTKAYNKDGYCTIGFSPCAIRDRYDFGFGTVFDMKNGGIPIYGVPRPEQ